MTDKITRDIPGFCGTLAPFWEFRCARRIPNHWRSTPLDPGVLLRTILAAAPTSILTGKNVDFVRIQFPPAGAPPFFASRHKRPARRNGCSACEWGLLFARCESRMSKGEKLAKVA